MKGATQNLVTQPGIETAVSALWIARGSRLIADGTRKHPIIFTFEEDDVNDLTDVGLTESGKWGGIVICGNALLNSANDTDGNLATPIYDQYEGTSGPGANNEHLFGGNDDTDNSGAVNGGEIVRSVGFDNDVVYGIPTGLLGVWGNAISNPISFGGNTTVTFFPWGQANRSGSLYLMPSNDVSLGEVRRGRAIKIIQATGNVESMRYDGGGSPGPWK